MADYFACVELHGAKLPTDYQGLHEALKEHRFTNCIAGTGGLVLAYRFLLFDWSSG